MVAVVCTLAAAELPLNAQCTPGTVGTNPPAVKTAQYDIARDGLNNQESILTASALKAKSVTLCQPSWSPLPVDAPPSSMGVGTYNPIYAQPLYVPGVQIAGNGNCGTDQNQHICNMIVFPTLYGSVLGLQRRLRRPAVVENGIV